LTYAVPSVVEQGLGLEIVVETNVTERRPHRPIVDIPFEFSLRDTPLQTKINGYDIHEMLGTKMRALFQRKRGRSVRSLLGTAAIASTCSPRRRDSALVENVPEGRFKVAVPGQQVFEELNAEKLDGSIE
jgi:hypothetical protein